MDALKVIALSLLLLFLFLAYSQTAFSGRDPKYRLVLFENGAKMKVEVAHTPQARQKGLMFRKSLPEGTGMLFIFPKEAPHRFWTKNCQFPLDMIWFNKAKEIIYIVENVPPCNTDSCPNFGPEMQNALYVIEAEAGFVKRNRLAHGMKIDF